MKPIIKIVIYLFSVLSLSSYAQEVDPVAEWQRLSPQEQNRIIEEATREAIDPNLLSFLNRNNISIQDYPKYDIYQLEDGSYSIGLPENNNNAVNRILNNFFKTFENARMYYNTEHKGVEICSSERLINCTNRGLQYNTGDYYITEYKINENNTPYFKINIQQQNYYVNALDFISDFNIFTFYELPSNYHSEFIEQINYYLRRTANFNFMVNLPTFKYCQENNTYIATSGYCENYTNIPIESVFKINSFNNGFLYFTYDNKTMRINKEDFYRMIQNKTIIRTSF